MLTFNGSPLASLDYDYTHARQTPPRTDEEAKSEVEAKVEVEAREERRAGTTSARTGLMI